MEDKSKLPLLIPMMESNPPNKRFTFYEKADNYNKFYNVDNLDEREFYKSIILIIPYEVYEL